MDHIVANKLTAYSMLQLANSFLLAQRRTISLPFSQELLGLCQSHGKGSKQKNKEIIQVSIGGKTLKSC